MVPCQYDLGVKECIADNKVTCNPGYIIAENEMSCIKCEAIECDGAQITNCSDLNHYILDKDCAICPIGSSCDGVTII